MGDELNGVLGGKGFEPVVGCRRTSALAARCDYRLRRGGRVRCAGRLVVIQRPDGRRASIEGGRRACRAG